MISMSKVKVGVLCIYTDHRLHVIDLIILTALCPLGGPSPFIHIAGNELFAWLTLIHLASSLPVF